MMLVDGSNTGNKFLIVYSSYFCLDITFDGGFQFRNV
jgi:hypothetical protein